MGYQELIVVSSYSPGEYGGSGSLIINRIPLQYKSRVIVGSTGSRRRNCLLRVMLMSMPNSLPFQRINNYIASKQGNSIYCNTHKHNLKREKVEGNKYPHLLICERIFQWRSPIDCWSMTEIWIQRDKWIIAILAIIACPSYYWFLKVFVLRMSRTNIQWNMTAYTIQWWKKTLFAFISSSLVEVVSGEEDM